MVIATCYYERYYNLESIVMRKKINNFIIHFTTLLVLIGINSYSLANIQAPASKDLTSTSFIEELKISAEENNEHAQLILGFFCFYGESSIPQDYKEAKKWFQRASEQGVSEATNMLAIMYLKGQGVAPDQKKAEELFIQAKTMRSITE